MRYLRVKYVFQVTSLLILFFFFLPFYPNYDACKCRLMKTIIHIKLTLNSINIREYNQTSAIKLSWTRILNSITIKSGFNKLFQSNLLVEVQIVMTKMLKTNPDLIETFKTIQKRLKIILFLWKN